MPCDVDGWAVDWALSTTPPKGEHWIQSALEAFDFQVLVSGNEPCRKQLRQTFPVLSPRKPQQLKQSSSAMSQRGSGLPVDVVHGQGLLPLLDGALRCRPTCSPPQYYAAGTCSCENMRPLR